MFSYNITDNQLSTVSKFGNIALFRFLNVHVLLTSIITICSECVQYGYPLLQHKQCIRN